MKKYLMMLFALLMMGSASVVMTSCGDDDDEKGSSKGPKTVNEAMSMLYGQWKLPQAFTDFMFDNDFDPDGVTVDEYYIDIQSDGNWGLFYRVGAVDEAEYKGYIGKYIGMGTITKESEDYCFVSPDEENPSTGLFPFAFNGIYQLPYRNLTNESVEVNFYLVRKGEDRFNGLGWQKLTKVKKPITDIINFLD